jgi:hypothetical protein
VRGRRLATAVASVGADAERDAWTVGAVPEADGDAVDVIVVAPTREDMTAAGLKRLRGAIDQEGLLALWTDQPPARLNGYLRAHHFRVVGWDPAPRGSGATGVLVTARPA